jgi:predicted GIY-YIG superfamily endonuclease
MAIERKYKQLYFIGCLYFINEENINNYKIGYTTNINKRLVQLQTG